LDKDRLVNNDEIICWNFEFRRFSGNGKDIDRRWI